MTALAGPPTSGLRLTPGSRRGAELGLLAFALVLVLAAYASVGIGAQDRVPADTLSYAGAFIVIFGLAHLVVRRIAPYADPILLPVVAALNGLGLVLIHRLDLAEQLRDQQLGRAVRSADAPLQMVWTAVGVGLFIAVLLLVRDHRVLQRYTYTAGAVGLAALALPGLLPASISQVNGAKIWIRVAGFSIQPGEFAKLILIIFFAGYLVAKRDVLALASQRVAGLYLPRARDLGPVLVVWALTLAVLVVEHDLGTSLLFFGIFIALLYVATERTSWLLLGVGLFLGGSYLAYHFVSRVQERVGVWLHPFAEAQDQGFQIVQGLFGLATGGIFGTGLGQGNPGKVPFAKTDFILTSIGEELGVVGVMAVVLLLGLVVERGLRAALSVRDSFGKLLAGGLAISFALQVFVVVGGVTRLIPLTGLTLPFLSYGGSSLVANYALVALLLRTSDAARRPGPALVTPGVPLAEARTEVIRHDR